jgi:enamine deaminase RidA (YjgF/YER057c/UK114 family)
MVSGVLHPPRHRNFTAKGESRMSGIRRLDAGPRLSEALIHEGRVYTSGFVAEEKAGGSIFDQTVDVLNQIDAMLARAGSDKSRLLKANIWLADIGTFDEMNRAWDAWVLPGAAPVRATVEAKLADPSYGVEIMIEAALSAA